MIDLTWNDIKEHVCKSVTKRCSLQNSQMGETNKKKFKLSKKTKRFDLVLHKSTCIQKSKQIMFTTELTNKRNEKEIVDIYGSEFDERVKQLYDQWHGLFVDVGVQDVQELGRLCHQVHRLDVVKLVPDVVLQQ